VSGDIHIDIEVKNEDKVAPALVSGLEEGLEEAGEWMQEKGEAKARDIVMGTDRVWNRAVKHGFTTNENQFNRYYHWKGSLVNTAPHAMIVEKGLAPAGEITGSTPSVQDILPWVDSEVTPNAAAQESARHANLENWDPELRILAEEYGTANVIAAFAIAKKIKDKGYPGIRFMAQTEAYLETKRMNVKQKVEKQMNKELRAAGLK